VYQVISTVLVHSQISLSSVAIRGRVETKEVNNIKIFPLDLAF